MINYTLQYFKQITFRNFWQILVVFVIEKLEWDQRSLMKKFKIMEIMCIGELLM